MNKESGRGKFPVSPREGVPTSWEHPLSPLRLTFFPALTFLSALFPAQESSVSNVVCKGSWWWTGLVEAVDDRASWNLEDPDAGAAAGSEEGEASLSTTIVCPRSRWSQAGEPGTFAGDAC